MAVTITSAVLILYGGLEDRRSLQNMTRPAAFTRTLLRDPVPHERRGSKERRLGEGSKGWQRDQFITIRLVSTVFLSGSGPPLCGGSDPSASMGRKANTGGAISGYYHLNI